MPCVRRCRAAEKDEKTAVWHHDDHEELPALQGDWTDCTGSVCPVQGNGQGAGSACYCHPAWHEKDDETIQVPVPQNPESVFQVRVLVGLD